MDRNKNLQILCPKCGVLVHDEWQGIEDRHAFVMTMGYSDCQTWGLRRNHVDTSSENLCSKCYGEWEQITLFAKAWLHGDIDFNHASGVRDDQPQPERRKASLLWLLPRVLGSGRTPKIDG